MKYDVLDLEGKKTKSIELPEQFTEEYEPDLVKRAVLAIFSKMRQAYGSKYGAGGIHSGKLSRRRRDYKTSYGHGISRVPRKTTWKRGAQFGWVGANVSGAVGGRMAHPPKPEKIWEHKINKKERRKAIRSALNGLVSEKKMIIFEDGFEGLKKLKDIRSVLIKAGLGGEIERIEKGRKTRQGPLIVFSKECAGFNASKNLQGFDAVSVSELNAMLLTKGHKGVRSAVWSEGAINKIKENKLFKK